MLARNLFLLAVKENYDVQRDNIKVHCDNKSTIFTFQRKGKLVPAGVKNANIQCVLRQVCQQIESCHLAHHVHANQDDYTWCSLFSLEAQINCMCGDLLKAAINVTIMHDTAPTETLPLKDVIVVINGEKQTTDVAKGL